MSSAIKSRTRNYVSILYPDSAIENWRDILIEECVPAFVSPLHDSDKTSDDLQKKPHYHIMLLFNSVKTRQQAQDIFDKLGAIKCQPVNDVIAQARYFCHLDQPTKHQYPINAVEQFGGADYYTLINLTSDKYKSIMEVYDYIRENNIVYYCDLATAFPPDDPRFRTIVDNSAVIYRYIKSLSYKSLQTLPPSI